MRAVSLPMIGDVFTARNANTVPIPTNNRLATAFNTMAQNLSPRIFRTGLVVGFRVAVLTSDF